MSEFEWLFTDARYLVGGGIIILAAAVLFAAYLLRRPPAPTEEGENSGELANMMLLLRSMSDILEEHKTLAHQFNQNLEQKLAHVEQKNRAARQRADEVEQRAAKLEGRLKRMREELAVLYGEIEAASQGAPQERGPGPLTFSQAGGAPSAPESTETSESAPGSLEEQASEQAQAADNAPEDVEAVPRENRQEPEAQAPLRDRDHEQYVDASAPSPDEPRENAEPPTEAPHPSFQADTPQRGRMPWDWGVAKQEREVKTGDDLETPIRSEESPAHGSGNDESIGSDGEVKQERPQWEQAAFHIPSAPEEETAEPEQADTAGYRVGPGFTGQSPQSAHSANSGHEQGHKTPEPSDPEAARQAFRALLNMGQESRTEATNRTETETLDQPSSSDESRESFLQTRVYEYSDAGMSIGEIASELGIGIGEVRLILSLRGQEES